MSKRTGIGLVALVCFVLGLIVGGQMPLVHGQATKVKDPNWLYGLDLKSRKVGEPDFNEKTKKYALEVFKDENTGAIIYISETGSIAVIPGK